MKCEAAGTGRLVPPCRVYSVASNTFKASMNTIMGEGIRLNRYTVGSALQVQEEVSDATVPESDESSFFGGTVGSIDSMFVTQLGRIGLRNLLLG